MKLQIFKNMTIPETLIKIYTAQPIDHKTQQVIDLVKGTTTTNYVRAFWMKKCISSLLRILAAFIQMAKRSVWKLLIKFILANFASTN